MLVSCPTIRFLQPIQRQTFHGCINHDLIVGLCSELLMSLSYYIHLGFGKTFLAQHGDRTQVLPNVSHQLYDWIKALTVVCLYVCFMSINQTIAAYSMSDTSRVH